MNSTQFQIPISLGKLLGGLALIGSFGATQVNATGFLLAPTRLFFEGSTRSQELTVMNQTDETQTYRLRLEDRRLRDLGKYDVITDPADPEATSQMLRLSVRQVTVPARSSATVRVLLRKPSGQPTGEVRSHLLVTELPKVKPPTAPSEPATEISIEITPVYGISIPILVRTGETSSRVSSATVERIAYPESPDLESVKVTVVPEGNRSLFVDLRLVSTRQRREGPIMQMRSVALYAPLGPRTFVMSLTPEQTAKLRAGNVALQYQAVDRSGSPIGAPTEVAF